MFPPGASSNSLRNLLEVGCNSISLTIINWGISWSLPLRSPLHSCTYSTKRNLKNYLIDENRTMKSILWKKYQRNSMQRPYKKAKLQAGIKLTALCSAIDKENSIEFPLDFLHYLYNYYMVCALPSHTHYVTSHVTLYDMILWHSIIWPWLVTLVMWHFPTLLSV